MGSGIFTREGLLLNWSYSSSRAFAACPRRWFYRSVVAHHAAKDPLRREAYLLGKLDSLPSWRGRLVDEVISEKLVSSLAVGRVPEPSDLLTAARARFEAQLAFATTHRLNDPGLKPSREPDFLALREFEVGVSPGEAELTRLWEGVETALANLINMTALLERLLNARLLLPQRPLSYTLVLPDGEGVTVRAVPDLLAFFRNAPPLIIDWKVSARAATTHLEQLTGYALALDKSREQSGLPPLRTGAADTELLEVQLLTDERRRYGLREADLEMAEVQAAASASRMRALLKSRKKGDLDPYTVPPTADLRACDGCVFKQPCWAGAGGPRREVRQGTA